MDWTTLAAAFLGGGFGGAIPAAVSGLQLRRDKAQALQARRWVDAEIVADAKKLLTDLDPQRRTLNVNPAPGAEAALWKDLNQRKDQLDRQLLLLAAGHPSQEISTAATELGLALVWSAHQTELTVQAQLANRDIVQLLDDAKKRHETAAAAVNKLAEAVKDAAVPKRRFLRRSPQKELTSPPPQARSS